MQKFIFLDTNNWIYLSNGFNIYSNKHDELHLKVFETIRKRVKEGNLVFLINDIVLSEWERNKEQSENQIKEIEKKFKGHTGNLKSLNEFIGGEKTEEIDALKKSLEEKYKEKIARHKNHIKNVEFFLKNETVKIQISDKTKIDASNLALEKKAPFIGDKRNSMADALILLSSIEYLYENHKFPDFSLGNDGNYFFPDSFFVSSNSGDFSSSEDKEKIHKDLEPFLKKTNTKFFYTLGKLINSLEVEFLTEEEENIIEHVDDRVYCDICDCDYYPSVNFSDYFEVYNPNKKFVDKNQYSFEFPEIEHNLIISEEMASPMSSIRTAECEHCGAEFIECLCGEINHIEDYNTIIECIGGCGTKFRINADIDRKGMVHSIEYELIKEFRCTKCGDEFEEVDENGLCEECAEYERISNEE
ncbi:DUF4935 domain-containing protein [Maribellus sp. CM-23]|uniref:PIN domain-containing protein n=1 Tax=Maribellus sp. CM-23 TaxID=2781026 RepID=UPI001F17EAA7|nr:PIN domain-containing protein [Maribellus sp. CM-23]MCE4564354.1 DUF4935 domain-containing protein [Maribellus sp. CM-23]